MKKYQILHIPSSEYLMFLTLKNDEDFILIDDCIESRPVISLGSSFGQFSNKEVLYSLISADTRKNARKILEDIFEQKYKMIVPAYLLTNPYDIMDLLKDEFEIIECTA